MVDDDQFPKCLNIYIGLEPLGQSLQQKCSLESTLLRARPKYCSDKVWSCWLAFAWSTPHTSYYVTAHWGDRVLTLDTQLYKRIKWCPIYDEMQLQWHLFDMVPVYIDNVLKCQCSQTRARNVQAYITRDGEVLFTEHDGTVRRQPTT